MGCAASAPRTATQDKDATPAQKTRGTIEEPKSKGAKCPQNTGDGADLIKARPPAAPAQEEAKQKSRSRKSRARRLSYVDHTEDSALDVPEQKLGRQSGDAPHEDGKNEETAAVKRSKAARRRRLSYVVDEEDPKLKSTLGGHEGKPETAPKKGESSTLSTAARAAKDPTNASPSPAEITAKAGRVELLTACISRAGREPGFKKQNQDNCFAFDKYIQEGWALFGAFDGHGPEGHTISGYVKQHLPVLLANNLKASPPTSAAALKQCYLDVDKALNATKIDCEFSGSTACVAFLEGRLLNVAWVGDSRGVLGKRGSGNKAFQAVNMTTDHKPTCKDEQGRIVASSGRVERLVDESGQPIGPHRVWLQYAWIPGLAMSRALGDALAHQVGVISEPEVFTTALDTKDAFIILASDGVWEFIDSQAAVDIVGKASSAEEGCRQLVDEAFQRWLVEEDGVVDDITAVVVKFEYKE